MTDDEFRSMLERRKVRSDETALVCKDPSLTRCEFAEECSIRNIVKRFLKTGVLPQARPSSGITDATTLPSDFQTLMEKTALARQEFEQLPEEEREKYNNSVEVWLDERAKQLEESAEPVEDKSGELPQNTSKDSSANRESVEETGTETA